MSRLSLRSALLSTSAAAALAVIGAASASAQCTGTLQTGVPAANFIGGGSTLAGPLYTTAPPAGESGPGTIYGGPTAANYGLVGSGKGTTGFFENDSTCDGFAAKLGVAFGASDAITSPTSFSTFLSTNHYQAIQAPKIGTPVTIPYHVSGKTGNGGLALTDAQLCSYFSGKTKTYGIAYRADGSGTSFLLTQHLSKVCNSSNSNVTFTATTDFASLFPGHSHANCPPAIQAASATADCVPAGTFSTPLPSVGSGQIQSNVFATNNSIGYVGPDYTKIASSPTNPSQASYVASVNGKLPTTANTSLALSQAKNSTGTAPVATDPNSFAFFVANPSVGYPIVGYTFLLLSSIYQNATTTTDVRDWLIDNYNANGTTNNPDYSAITAKGFVPVSGVNQSSKPTANTLAADIVNAYLAAGAPVPIKTGSNGR